MKVLKVLAIFMMIAMVYGCGEHKRELPFIGENSVNSNGDTVRHSIPDFSFINQDGDSISQKNVSGKIYVADFFFTSCPTICPVMKTQMLRLYEKYAENPNFKILSHTIDPRHDTLEVLKNYKEKLGVKGSTWEFLTAEQDYIYELAQKSYLVSALEDETAVDEGGFIHSGAFVLVDKNRNIRGVYDGTKEIEVNRLMKDIDLLLKDK